MQMYLELLDAPYLGPFFSPRGSKYPIFKDSGPKYHAEYGFWNLRYLVLGPSGS